MDLFFPKRCVVCGKIGSYICRSCSNDIGYIQHQICSVCGRNAVDGFTHPGCKNKYSMDGIFSFFRYKGVIQKATKTIKYRLVYDLSKELVGLIPQQDIKYLKDLLDKDSIITSIPLHFSRQKKRGFNQAEILGKELSKRLEISYKRDILKRAKKTIPQTEMKDRKKRLFNMKDVFAIKSFPDNLRFKKIVLFDDVYTTGATLRSAANVLKRAGAKYVFGVTLAHG